IPIHEPSVWDVLSFTKGNTHTSSVWTGMVRRSLNRIPDEDGHFLEQVLARQAGGGPEYPVDEDAYRRLVSKPIRRADRTVAVTVPVDDEGDTEEAPAPRAGVRESSKVQALLASVGEKMG